MNRYAAIDLGTNTFHMIIVDVYNGQPKVIYRKRHFVKLAYEGFDEIGDLARQRGINALLDFKDSLNYFKVTSYKAYGTSIFRRAENGKEFIFELKRKTNLVIRIISGSDEAQLIFEGAKMLKTLGESDGLIMDVGGGSVEFILFRNKEIVFEKSYPIGILELYHRYGALDTQNENSLFEIEKFLIENTKELQSNLKSFSINTLIGTAGSFDVLNRGMKLKKGIKTFELSNNDFTEIFNSVAFTSEEERLSIKWIPRERQKLIVFAFSIIDFALKVSSAKRLRITSYSMKEGMIGELMKENYQIND